jgi:predicted dehydrogenase
MANDSTQTRRDLLKASAAAVAAPAFLAAQNLNDEIRVAIIGVGGRGSAVLERVVKSPNVRLVAVCDIDAEARDRGASIGQATNPDLIVDYRRLLDRNDIDAVVIATPVDLHKEMAVAVLGSGRSLYLEKPMGRTAEEVKAVGGAAAAAKGVLQLGFQLRYDPPRRAAIEEIHNGGIGQVAYMQGNRHTRDLPRETAWLFDASRSGNMIVEQAVHIMDLMNWAMKSHPIRVMGSGGINVYHNVPQGRTTYDNYAVIYEYPGDVRLCYTHLFIDPPGFTGITEKIWGTEFAVDLPSATKYRLTQERGAQPEPLTLFEGDRGDMTQAAVNAFFGHVRDNSEPLNNATYGKYATLMAIMGRMAIEEKRIVSWDEVDL